MKKIYFTVTNDLTYDQRMHRICRTLTGNGYNVALVGRRLSSSLPLQNEKYRQYRLRCWFNKGKLFYAEYNIRLFFFLLFKKMDAICAIDLDTILPCLTISRWKKIIRIYDAHEFFTEMKEVMTRPAIQKAWRRIERKALPKFKWGYTVSNGLAREFQRLYGVNYETIRNLPYLQSLEPVMATEKFLLYQGAVNEARGFEQLIPAMKMITCKLVICGDGNFMQQLKALIKENKVEDKVVLKGMLPPDELWRVSRQAYIGIHVPEKEGLNQFLALPNKFFEYVHAAIPQVTVAYPEYQEMNAQWEVAILIAENTPARIAEAVNNLLVNDVLHHRLRENCLQAREVLNWQQEEKKLVRFYQSVFKE